MRLIRVLFTNNAVYTAIALRSENVYYSPYSGDVNYYRERRYTELKKEIQYIQWMKPEGFLRYLQAITRSVRILFQAKSC